MYNVIVTKFDKDVPYTVADEVYVNSVQAEAYAWRCEQQLSPCRIDIIPYVSKWSELE